ncbi:hypothetical protein SeMB42_g02285 [Synchytrium endobioticum]|uniref:Uncharacterized protein n=1 Tax=Synchytrium endobioticum TaxID=286115 RepID=A0A507DHD2_9FUNG|nr:hypothetical protein SeMB42_g02285 [Synchytrium endobioticum]
MCSYTGGCVLPHSASGGEPHESQSCRMSTRMSAAKARVAPDSAPKESTGPAGESTAPAGESGASTATKLGLGRRTSNASRKAKAKAYAEAPAGCIFESQMMSPAPGTTYFQVAVMADEGKVILRDWPRQRFSQKWTRDGALNPSQVTETCDNFVQGSLKEEITRIFGASTYDHVLKACEQIVEARATQAAEP